jgi:hypothetical protein
MASQYYQQIAGSWRNNVVFLVSRKHHPFPGAVPGFGTATGSRRIQYREQFASEAH